MCDCVHIGNCYDSCNCHTCEPISSTKQASTKSKKSKKRAIQKSPKPSDVGDDLIIAAVKKVCNKKEFETGAQKEIAGKLMLELITPEMINALGEILTYGAQKYANRNWEKGIPLMQSYAAAMRHMLKWAQNIDLDEESNLNHISHAMCNLGMIITQIKRNRKDLDDRPK